MVVCDKNAEIVYYAHRRVQKTIWFRCLATGSKLGQFAIGMKASTHVQTELAMRDLNIKIVRILQVVINTI
jgi:hypothetical protein